MVRDTARVLPRFEVVGRLRPFDLLAPGQVAVDVADPDGGAWPVPQPAPYVAAVAEVGAEVGAAVSGAEPARVWLRFGEVVLEAVLGSRGSLRSHLDLRSGVTLQVTADGATTTHRSRRHGRTRAEPDALALTLTGSHATVFVREDGGWVARARVDLRDRWDAHDPAQLAALQVGAAGTGRLRAGGFGQLGLRDLRLVSHADGTQYDEDGLLLLTATSAGPGFFGTGHTSVWSLGPGSRALHHRGDLFFTRPDRPGVYGDHATHLVRDGETWLVATSTWGDFDPHRDGARVATTLATSTADLTSGRHVLTTRPLDLPTTGLTSVGIWDPHLVRDGATWRVGYVSASRFFRFHPVLAEGPSLDSLALRAAAADRRATEGTTLLRLEDGWRVLASDGRDGRRGQRAAYPVFDLDLAQVGALDAPYPTNLPWPTLARTGPEDWLMVAFDGTPRGGPLLGYGTHGDVVLLRTATPGSAGGPSPAPPAGPPAPPR